MTSPARDPDRLVLDCPQCVEEHGEGRSNRIGNRRGSCKTCAAHAIRVSRAATRELRRQHPEMFAALTRATELEVYEALVKDEWGFDPRIDRTRTLAES